METRFSRVLADGIACSRPEDGADAYGGRHPKPLPRGPDTHRPSRAAEQEDLPPLRGRGSRHALLFLQPAAEPERPLGSI